MIGNYKPRPEAYRTCAKWLGYRPDELLMVACHNFDLMAAREAGIGAPSCSVRRNGGLPVPRTRRRIPPRRRRV